MVQPLLQLTSVTRSVGAARAKMHEYLGGTVRGLGGITEVIDGAAEHVHLLVGLHATPAPAI